jgi:hypothetical protein
MKCNNTSLPPLASTRVTPFDMHHACHRMQQTEILLRRSYFRGS